jgi:apolipoprotein N-acyltransferase
MRREGASVLAQLSNEAWFGPTSAPRQMLTSAIFRAVENNIEVIRAANSGASARIDRYGIVRGETPMFETATRSWKIRNENESRGDGVTFYTRHGDVFAVSCVVLAGLSLLGSVAHGAWKRRED